MDSSSKSFQDIEPQINWQHYPESHVLTVTLKDFTRNDLKVQVTSTGKLRITGERRLTSGKWLRFLKEIVIPADADSSKISAKLEKGILYVTQPRNTSAVSSNNPPAQPPKPKAESQPPPTAAKPTDRPNTPKSKNERPRSQANGKQSATPLKPHEAGGAPASTQESGEKPTAGGGEPVRDLGAKDRTEEETEEKEKAHTKVQDASEKTRKEGGVAEGSEWARRGEWVRTNMVNLALGAAVFVIAYFNLFKE